MKYLKLFFRLLLGLFMTYAGFSHLTFNRQEFVAQVPTWLQFSPDFTDFVVLASGVVEIAFGLGIIFLCGKWRAIAGALLALFYVADSIPIRPDLFDCSSNQCLSSLLCGLLAVGSTGSFGRKENLKNKCI